MPNDDNVIPFPIGGRKPVGESLDTLRNAKDFLNGVHQSVIGAEFRLRGVVSALATVRGDASRRTGTLADRAEAAAERTKATLHEALSAIEGLEHAIENYENALRRI